MAFFTKIKEDIIEVFTSVPIYFIAIVIAAAIYSAEQPAEDVKPFGYTFMKSWVEYQPK